MTPPMHHEEDFQLETIDRLARIETMLDTFLAGRNCVDHTRRIEILERRVVWVKGGLAAIIMIAGVLGAFIKWVFTK